MARGNASANKRPERNRIRRNPGAAGNKNPRRSGVKKRGEKLRELPRGRYIRQGIIAGPPQAFAKGFIPAAKAFIGVGGIGQVLKIDNLFIVWPQDSDGHPGIGTI